MPTQRYAGIRWMLPIFFFLIDEKKPGSDLLLEMLDYALKNYVSSEKASVTACIKGGFHLVKKTGVDYVKEESREYLEALSQAGYIIGNMVLPGSFVKKKHRFILIPCWKFMIGSLWRQQSFSQLRQGSF